MKRQADLVREALTDYLSAAPDRTATNRDCQKAVSDVLGYKVNERVVRNISRELGITKFNGSLSGKLGDTFITYWQLPEARLSSIIDLDREMAEGLKLATASNDSNWIATCLEYGERRPRQVLMALAQLAAVNGQAPAK